MFVLAATKVQNFDDINEAIVENLKKMTGFFGFATFAGLFRCRKMP